MLVLSGRENNHLAASAIHTLKAITGDEDLV